MRIVGGNPECAHCGAHLDIEPDQIGIVVFCAASGKPNVRAVLVDGREIHRCEAREDKSSAYLQR